ncbi:M4 family metallopeptidase [Actinokineospora enzanensis]|uniref:M4 family metallopeptidase n=1 Tax=Actinokineospora enzanensis TaxID=155975 RepID=UPI00037DDBC6|nr:M4 family metallopeptidase [Actinokineospora enzanensis]
MPKRLLTAALTIVLCGLTSIPAQAVTGTGTSAWNLNPVPLDTTFRGGQYVLQDPQSPGIYCQDGTTRTTFSSPDNTWGNGDPGDRETACVDAFYAAQTFRRMTVDWLGRNGASGNGREWYLTVGGNETPGQPGRVVIPRTREGAWGGTLDVIGHEYAHLVDTNTPGGLSGGGTSEFIADAFGTAAEWYANQPEPGDTPDFLIGERANRPDSGAVRNMYHPSLTGGLDCYNSTVPTQEIHRAAGPGDHWFTLLAQGSNPTTGPASPTCDGSTITGIGVRNAIRVLYVAMLTKNQSFSYPKYRVATLAAARNLTPGDCATYNTVKAAWNAVSVPAQTGESSCLTPPVRKFTPRSPAND